MSPGLSNAGRSPNPLNQTKSTLSATQGVAGAANTPMSLSDGFLFGFASVVVPWFAMQPALGLGVSDGREGPQPRHPALHRTRRALYLMGVSLYAGSALHTAVTG